MKGRPPNPRRIRHGVRVKYKSYRWTFDGVVIGAVYSDNPMKKDHITAVVIQPERYGLKRHTFEEECKDMEIVPIERVRIRRD
ncbi:hypothetical protein H340_01259 [Streptomyces mobaraensis NBRC 13819 = DSM 40847]|uniref:Uncharacterized protein n=1 Tax=Streptomyces mobaraensis (strain ATCC 29032 / DSM 40847 / JCM 4168 / NBRC 13819 / NCIMB 11159 / IPCR 16-22) TaxID=1223523 RepID=M3CEE3_STRM1|nr:hypothetical protein H340_01259 [Streptomyces mobaraensis NBRC 13819 = DSM 40847]